MDENVKEYEDLLRMFDTDGWRIMVREAKEKLAEIRDNAVFAKSFDQLSYMRGQAEQLAYLVNLEESVSIGYTAFLSKADSDEG